MSDIPKEPPLFADEGGTPFGSPPIDLAGYRIKVGRADTRVAQICEHKNLIYSRSERRIWCEDCERTLDAFDAFSILTTHFHAIERAANAKLATASKALASTVGRRSAKMFDKAWSGHVMAVCCPFCSAGLLPEDFEHGGSQRSGEIERQRRLKDRQ